MKKYIFTTILALFCRLLVSAQDTPPTDIQHIQPELLNRAVYKVWINDDVSKKWYLWGITDSTFVLGTSPDNPNTGIKIIPVEQVKRLKTRKVGSFANGFLLGGAIAGLAGYIGGNAQGDDPPCTDFICLDRRTAKVKGIITALIIAPIGMVVGCIAGGYKHVTTIKGSRAVLAAEKQNLRKYQRWR